MPKHSSTLGARLCRSCPWAAVGLAAVLALAMGPWLAPPLAAQENGAQIRGAVADATGAPIAGVAVTVTNQDTGVARTLPTGADGRYLIGPLPPGRYSISVRKSGFETVTVTGLVLQIGTDLQHDFSLNPATVQSAVTVTGEVPPIDTTKTNVSGVVTQEQIEDLPVNTRQYLNLALLMPGTTQNGSRTFYNNVQVGGGGYYYANGFEVDGVSNNWAEEGEPRQNFPEGSVQEFSVITAVAGAQYGLHMGGQVAIVTKSGTNQFHGEAFEYFRNTSLNHLNEFQQQAEQEQDTGNPPYHRNQFGFDIGGPIIQNRLHFYAAYEGTFTDSSYTVFTGLPQYYGSLQGTYNQPSHDEMLTLRVDDQISNSQTFFARYAQEWNFLSCEGCGGTAAAESGYDGQIPRHSLVVGHTWILTPTMVNDARFQYADASYLLGPAGEPIWTQFGTIPASVLSEYQTALNFPSLSWGHNYGEIGRETHWEGNDTLSFIRGAHNIKVGFDDAYIPFADENPYGITGTYYFGVDQPFNPANMSAFQGLDPTLYLQTIPPVYTSVPTGEVGFFVNDDWTAARRLTVDLGLRYDREFGSFNEGLNPNNFTNPATGQPEIIPYMGDPAKRGDKRDFGPRVGFSWDVKGDGHEVLRAGYGIYYNNILTLQNFSENRDLAQCNIVIVNPTYPNPFGGQSPSSFCSTAPPNVTVLAPNFANPYSEQYDFGWSQEITPNFSVHVDGVDELDLRDYRVVDLNFPDSTGVRPLADWGQISQYDPMGKATYKALMVRADKRFARNFQFLISYTLASAFDNNPQNQVTNETDYNADWGPSNIDQHNSLVSSGSFQLPWHVELGAIWTWNSTLPFNMYTTTTDADGISQYVPGTTRNSGNRDLDFAALNAYRAAYSVAQGLTTPLPAVSAADVATTGVNDIDIRASRSFFVHEQRRLEAIVQVFNVLGHENFTSINSNASSPSFGVATAASNLQQAELALRFVF